MENNSFLRADAYQRGYYAFIDQERKDTNPYINGNDLFNQFNRGYEQAEEDYRNYLQSISPFSQF